MSYALALLQADPQNNQTLLIMLGVLGLITLVVLGLRLFRNMFEVITAPQASLKYHGENDHFFFSLMLVFLGGLIATIIMIANQAPLVESFNSYAGYVAGDIAAGNPNPIYRDVAQSDAERTIASNFDIYIVKNLIMMPLLFIGLWIFIGTFTFLFAKMFGGAPTWVDVHGTLAYGAFFFAIGLGLAAPAMMDTIISSIGGPGGGMGVAGIIGFVLILYSLVLYMIGVPQSAELSGGQTVGVIIAMLVILGGLGFFANYKGAETFDAFRGRIQSFNPAQQQI